MTYWEEVITCPYCGHDVILGHVSRDTNGWKMQWCMHCEYIHGRNKGFGKFLAKFVAGHCVATKELPQPQ